MVYILQTKQLILKMKSINSMKQKIKAIRERTKGAEIWCYVIALIINNSFLRRVSKTDMILLRHI